MNTSQIDPLSPKHLRQWSITLRLAWIYALSAFCVLLITTFSLHWAFNHRLEQENAQFIERKILVLQEALEQTPQDLAELEEELVIEAKLYHYYSRIIDAASKVINETPKMSEVLPATIFTSITPQETPPFSSISWNTFEKSNKHKQYFLLGTAKTKNNETIQIALDITGEHKIIADNQRWLLMVLFIGIICSAILGIIVARKGLQPLHQMIQSTKRITIKQLNKRLDPSSWPKELSALAQALNSMLDRIEENVDRLSQFSGDLAHDLRTPINNLLGEAEITLSRPRSNEEYKHVIESSMEEYQHITHMIESLLFLANAENPETVINPMSLSLKQLMEDIRDFYEAAAEEQKVNIICQGDVNVMADPILLRRALNNLVSNALRYTPSGGTIQLSAQESNGRTTLSVSDNGEGIPEEHLSRLFNRFYRADSARSKKTGGTGLGLAIVKSIMDLHKGQAIVTSTLNKGTTVALIF